MWLDVVGVGIVTLFTTVSGRDAFFLDSSRAQGNHSCHSSSFSNDSKQSTQIISDSCIQWFRAVLVRIRSGYVWFVLVFLVKFLFEAMGATEATVDEASLAQDVASVLGRRCIRCNDLQWTY